MTRIHRLDDVLPEHRNATAAIGNFDGVHLGHRAVLETARAARPDRPLAVLTFEPHPREVFRPGEPPFRLTNAEARTHRLEKLGVGLIFELEFGSVREMPHETFVQKVLHDGLGLAHVTVGADFRYGKDRAGTTETLRQSCEALGMGISIADLVSTGPNAPRISSTAIRAALSEGRPRDAAAMLGHWHRVEGPVLHGAKRGRELGYPTANMALDRLHLPRFGVYAVLVDVLDGPHKGSYHGAASLGTRPQFGENVPNLETFLFDFSGDLYGAHLSVGLVDFLRPEAKFDSVDALVEQMKADCAAARNILGALA